MNVRSRAARVGNWARVIKIASVLVRERLTKKKPGKTLNFFGVRRFGAAFDQSADRSAHSK